MKFNSTFKLSLTLLLLMLGVGTASGWSSMKLGETSLRGISQPDTNPTKKLAGNNKNANQPKEFVPVDEKAIIKKVEDSINQESKKTDNQNKPQDKAKENVKTKTEKAESNATPEKSQEKAETNLPLQAKDGGVLLKIVKASRQGDSLILDVTLSNQGEKMVQFLYSFLEVKDTNDRPLSAIVENLPEELPTNGKIFAGTIRISPASLAETKKVSLNLTNYPEQNLKLSIANIPLE